MSKCNQFKIRLIMDKKTTTTITRLEAGVGQVVAIVKIIEATCHLEFQFQKVNTMAAILPCPVPEPCPVILW